MTNSSIQKVIDTAKQEINYLEKASNSQLDSKTANAGDKNFTKYARDLDNLGVYNGKKNGYAWCAVFVFWCLVQSFGLEVALKITNQPMKGYGAGCTELVKYYKAANSFVTTNPQPGDQIFFSKDKGKTFYHTGLVTAVSGGKVFTIEGNTSSTAGVVANGGAVRDKSYALTYNQIGGYGRPKYELLEEDEDMTQETFNKLAETWLAQKAVQPVTFETDAINWANENGILQGYSDGTFAPKKFITRGETVVVLKRFFDKFIKK